MTARTTNKNKVYIRIVTFFLILTIFAIFIVLHFALAKVNIIVHGNNEELSKKELVEMVPEGSGEMSEDNILGKIISTEFEILAQASSSMEMVESEKAGGYVTIYNNYSKDQVLVATTRLLTPDGKLYRIANRVNVPVGGNVKVWAEADQAGEEFVIGPTKLNIPGLWEGVQTYIYGETEGMTMKAQPQYIVTQENIDELKKELLNQAKAQAVDKINESLTDSLKVDADRLLLETTTIESSQLGDKSETIYIKEKIKAYGLVFSEDDLLSVAREKFAKELESNQSLIEFLPESFSYKIIESNLETKKAVIEVTLSAKVSSSGHLWEIDKEDLFGLSETQIREQLDKIGVKDVDIKFFPFWLKTVPKMKDHIIIE